VYEVWETLLPKIERELIQAKQRAEMTHRRYLLSPVLGQLKGRLLFPSARKDRARNKEIEPWRRQLFEEAFPNTQTFYELDPVASFLADDLKSHLTKDEFKAKLAKSHDTMEAAIVSHLNRVIDRFATLASCQPSDLVRFVNVFTYPLPSGDITRILLGTKDPICRKFRKPFKIDHISYSEEMTHKARTILKKCADMWGNDLPVYDGGRVSEAEILDKMDSFCFQWRHCGHRSEIRNIVCQTAIPETLSLSLVSG
jgi:hypothetical protein